MKKKRLFGMLLAFVMVLSLCSGCGKKKGDGTINVICTIFPIYDWTKNILGENPGGVEVKQLIAGGVDLHSYQPTAQDILDISECDIFIYVGGESDGWAEDALKNAKNKDMIVLNLMELLGEQVREEELVEGMQGEEEEPDDDEAGEEDSDHHHTGVEYDEHIWLSLRNAEILAAEIEKALEKADPDNVQVYQKNIAAYVDKMITLDDAYSDAVLSGSKDTLLFGDRFPFLYLVNDYKLKYYAAFTGCSAETEASFETIAFLSEKMDSLGLDVILTIETSDGSIAKTIIENSKSKNRTILTMDSMQSVTAADIDAGADYLTIMENNLEVLRTALK